MRHKSWKEKDETDLIVYIAKQENYKQVIRPNKSSEKLFQQGQHIKTPVIAN